MMNLDFQFDSIMSLWEMAGHGPYVWAAYGIFYTVLLALFFQNKQRRKEIVKKVKVAKLRSN